MAKARSIESCMAMPGLSGVAGARAMTGMRLLLAQKGLRRDAAFAGSVALLGAKSILATGGTTGSCTVGVGVGALTGPGVAGFGRGVGFDGFAAGGSDWRCAECRAGGGKEGLATTCRTEGGAGGGAGGRGGRPCSCRRAA